jgi:transcriptional regulator with XRE-family HTH domain
MSPFAGLLQRHRGAADLTRYELARRMRCDPSMLWRLEHDERVPSRALVLTAASALDLNTPDTDRLLLAAGYAPDWLVALAGVAPLLPREDRRNVS